MTKKIAYFATDAAGKVHTRSSLRVYTHTVVYQRCKEAAIRGAHAKWHAEQDGRNYDYQVQIAAGTHAHCTTVTPASGYHASYSAEHIAASQQRQRDSNAAMIEKAKADINGRTREQYIADRKAAMLARIETIDWTVWHNAGWSGRYDLALKVAAQHAGPDYAKVEILAASTK